MGITAQHTIVGLRCANPTYMKRPCVPWPFVFLN